MKQGTLDFESHNSRLERIIESFLFRYTIITLIVINAIILGILTYEAELNPGLVTGLRLLDHAITFVFVAEILTKLTVYRMGFFKLGWNWFDFIVVGLAVLPGGQGYTVLRAMRVLRVLRLLHIVPMFRRITEALLKALPGMGAIFAVLALLTYVAAVMATNMFGRTDNPEVLQLFGDLPSSAYSLFQVMTMDGWRFEVVQKVVDDGHTMAPFFFLIFIFIASFAILNLFIALIVEALAENQRETVEQLEDIVEEIDEDIEEGFIDADKEREKIIQLLTEIKAELADLKKTRVKPTK